MSERLQGLSGAGQGVWTDAGDGRDRRDVPRRYLAPTVPEQYPSASRRSSLGSRGVMKHHPLPASKRNPGKDVACVRDSIGATGLVTVSVHKMEVFGGTNTDHRRAPRGP